MFRLRKSLWFFLFWAVSQTAQTAPSFHPTQWVDPFIGTAGAGHTFPGALAPWGMVSVSPHNDLQAPSGYVQGGGFLYGFGQVHLSGMDCPDLGSVVLMPTTGAVKIQREEFKSAYDSEEASPGYYKVHLGTYDILAEMTASPRVGFSQYSFPVSKGDANILIDASFRLTSDPVTVKNRFEGRVKVVSPVELEGFSQSGDFCSVYSGNQQTVYFVIRFSKPAVQTGTWRDGKISGDAEQKGTGVGAFFRFSTADRESILVKTGISYVSVENARLNLETEIPGWDFDSIRAATRAAWDEELEKVEIKSGQPDQLRVFYTALYHALIHPNVFSDVNGEYEAMGHSGVRKADGYTRYSVFALWDSYRILHPLLTLLYPERELDMVKSLVEMGKESGWLPRWELAGNDTRVLVGDPAVPVIAGTYLSGLKNFDAESAYNEMKKSLDPKDNKLYGGLKSILQYGYIPKDDDSKDFIWGSLSTSLEYSLDFWNLARMAKALGKKEDYDRYIHLSGVYLNFYDPASGFLRARNKDGSWMEPFHPLDTCCDQPWPASGGPGYVEGNAWQYLFFAPQDMDGLKNLLGGDEVFVKRLQECFDGGFYDPTNEPDLSWPYLFNEVPGEAWRTQKTVRGIMEKYYKPSRMGFLETTMAALFRPGMFLRL